MQASLHQLLVAVHAHARRGGPAPTRHVPLLAAMLLLYMDPQAPTASHHSHPPQPPTTTTHPSPTLNLTLTLTLTKGARDHSTASSPEPNPKQDAFVCLSTLLHAHYLGAHPTEQWEWRLRCASTVVP